MSSWNDIDRRAILDEYFANSDLLERLDLVRVLSPEQERERLRLSPRQAELMKQYRDGLPKISLARCPFSGDIYAPSFDPLGVDGPWWNYYASQRPFEEPPSHWIALTGAMRFDATVEKAPFVAIPGPAVPYVFPRVLEHEAVKAVVHSFPVGRHTAYAITYFASAWPEGVTMPDIWGLDIYQVHLADGRVGWYHAYDTPDSRDFDLARWIAAGKLSWVAPGDPGMALRNTVPDCPYLGLEGCREEQRVVQGIVESGEPA